MSGQQLFPLGRRDEVGDGLRDETRQLGPLALDGVEKPGVCDRDRRLVGERLDELDLLVGERLRSKRAIPITPISSSSSRAGTPRSVRRPLISLPRQVYSGSATTSGMCTADRVSATRPTHVRRSGTCGCVRSYSACSGEPMCWTTARSISPSAR
jgi:hypothetical protein